MFGNNEISIPNEWDEVSVMISEDGFSALSCDEASKVFEEWRTDDTDHGFDLEIIEVDAQMGGNLCDDFVCDPCISPSCPMEELVFATISDDHVDKFSMCFMDENELESLSPVFDSKYNETLNKLVESMQRSRESRKSLSMKTPKTEKYERNHSISGVLSSIEMSSQQLKMHLQQL